VSEVAVITDIHGNLPALRAALARIDELGIEEIYCGGDLVGYGPHPNEVVALIADKSSHGRIAPGTTTGMPIIATHAPDDRGTYYLIACADGDEAYDEISDSNNCLAAPETVVVEGFPRAHAVSVDLGSKLHAKAGSLVRVSVRLQQPGKAKRAKVLVYLGSRSVGGRGLRLLGTLTAPRNRGADVLRVRASGRLRLPRSAPRTRRQFVLACLGKPRRAACVATRRPLFVTRARARR
jgi:hypothetical protein